jgi:hypothetical protein
MGVIGLVLMCLVACDQNGAEPVESTSPKPERDGSVGAASNGVTTSGSCDALVSLGRPGIPGPTALFSTTGGDFLVSASGFLHGGPLDPPRGVTQVTFGLASAPPSYNPRSASVSGALRVVTVHEGSASPVSLPSGRFWVWTSNTVTVTLAPCGSAELSSVEAVP